MRLSINPSHRRFISVALALLITHFVVGAAELALKNPSVNGPFLRSSLQGHVQLTIGTLGWNEPILGTANGKTMVNTGFAEPTSGWTTDVPARYFLVPSESVMAYPDLLGQSFSFSILPVGGHPAYAFGFGPQEIEVTGLLSSEPQVLTINTVDDSLFGEPLYLTIAGMPVFQTIPFPIPVLSVNKTVSGLDLFFDGGEPGTSWILESATLLNVSGVWGPTGLVVMLDANGEAAILDYPFTGPKLFFRAALLTP